MLAFAATTLEVGTARAEGGLELAWTAPAACPDRDQVIASVQRLVKAPPAQPLFVTATVREEGGAWIADVEMKGAATGKRTLRASTCASVTRATSLVVALTIDPDATLDDPPDGDATNVHPTPTPPPVVPPPPPPPPPATEAPSPLRPLVFAGVGGERALLPGVVPTVTFGGGLSWRALRFDLAAVIVPAERASLEQIPAAGADASFTALVLRTCLGQSWVPFAALGCAGLRGSHMSARGVGVTQSYRQTAEILDLEPSVVLRVPGRTRLAVELDAGVVLPLTRPDFVVLVNEAHDRVFRVSPIGARASLDLAFRF